MQASLMKVIIRMYMSFTPDMIECCTQLIAHFKIAVSRGCAQLGASVLHAPQQVLKTGLWMSIPYAAVLLLLKQ